MEWCHASGNAHQTSAPRMACPRVSGRMLRSRANNQAMAVPPMRVSGTSTGFGQCSALNINPATTAAEDGFSKAASSRFVKKEFRATCCSRQKAKYPTKRRLSIKCSGKRCSIPRNSPIRQIATEVPAKNQKARRVARPRLSSRHPSVLGVSRRRRKLTASHTKNTRQDQDTAACSRQMYQPTKAPNAKASTRHETRRQFHPALTPLETFPYNADSIALCSSNMVAAWVGDLPRCTISEEGASTND